MENSHERAADTRMRDTGLVPPDSLEQFGLEQMPDAPPPYVKEPLFNKKVMALWALGALAVWFAFSVIVPTVVEATRTSIREAVQEAERSPDGTITIRRNGKVITITRGAEPTVRVTDEGQAAPPAAPAGTPPAPAPAAGTAAPATPAEAPAPAKK
jgi:hypothetical protein